MKFTITEMSLTVDAFEALIASRPGSTKIRHDVGSLLGRLDRKSVV